MPLPPTYKRSYRQLRSGVILGRHYTWWLQKLSLAGFASVVIGVLLFIVALVVFSRDLPSPDKIVRRDGFATKIVDRNDKPIYEVFSEEKRIPVTLDQIPESLKLATIAVEDKDFYTHPGFDLKGMTRGVTKVFTEGRAQGGSTLTQQLVKNVLLTSERTLTRKLKEFVLSVQIERKFSKDEILQMYLNEAPYGGTARGAQAAANTYFGKDVSELSLSESIILAGLPQRPSYYSPFSGNAEAYITRADHVANRMHEDGHLSADELDQVKQDIRNIQFSPSDAGLSAPHFVSYVQQQLADRYGESAVEGSGLKVTTSLDLDLQSQAQTAVTEEIKKVENLNITNGAAVVLNVNTGEILAMVGSKNYSDSEYDGKYNVVTALRQPGSAIKPVTYLTALQKGYTASTLLMDVPTEFPGGAGQPPYTPVNYDGKFRGPVQMRYALANSLNIPAVKMLAMVGIRDTLKTAYEMGLTTLEPTKENMSRLGLSLTLGGGEVRLIELASAYSAFGNTGYRIEPVAILKVEDRHGKVLEEYKPQKNKRIITEEQAWLISDILSDNQARAATFGPNSSLNIPGREVAAKTGTSNDLRDNWTVGWTPSYAVGVWVGNNDNSQMKKLASGISGAAPIWRKIVLAVLDKTNPESFVKPDSIVDLQVDKISGYQAHDGFESRLEYFIPGTEPTGEDPIHVKIKTCKGQDKLATPSDIANSNFDEKEYLAFKEEDPTAGAGQPNKWQQAILNWLALPENADPKYHPPTEYCNQDNPVAVNFIEPRNHDQVNNNKFKVRVDPVSLKPIRKVEIYADGKLMASLGSPPWEDTITLDDGPHAIEVKARDEDGKEGSVKIDIGVNVPWDQQSVIPSTSPTPTSFILP